MQPSLAKQDTTSLPADYAFDNADEYAKGRYHELSVLYDAQTIRHLERTGIERGWRCLEVGGGGGSRTCFGARILLGVFALSSKDRINPFGSGFRNKEGGPMNTHTFVVDNGKVLKRKTHTPRRSASYCQLTP